MKMNLLLRRLQPNQLNEINLVEMLVVTAQPAEVFTLIDQSTGAVPEDLILKREGKDLLVEVDGEVVVRIMNFCAEDMNSTFSLDGSFSPEPEMAVRSDFALSEGAHDGIVWSVEQPGSRATDHAEGSGSSWGWWLAGGLGLAGGAGLALGGGGGGGSSSSNDGGGGGGPTVQTIINGSVVAGPVVSGHGLTATVYGSNGQALGTATINTDGSFSFRIEGGYSGPVLVQVADGNSAADYMDEGTGLAKDLSVDLRAVSTVSGNGSYTVNVNMLTELAVRELGLAGGDGGGSSTNISQITGAQISAANSNVAAAFGLEGTNPTTGNVAALINADGSANAAVNAYGQILAAISGMEATGNANTSSVLAQLSGGIDNGNMSDALKGALIEGAREAKADASQIGDLLNLVPPAPGLALAVDTGRSNTDGITNVGTIHVTGLEAGATWQYSTNGGSTWTTGTGTAFSLSPGTYSAGKVQVQQTNTVDNTSGAGSNTGAIIVDTTAPAIGSLVVSANNVVDGSDTLSTVAYNGTTTGVENGQTVSLTIGGVATTTTVNANTFSGTVNLSNVADGRNIATTANVGDVAGNPAPQFSGSFDKDLNAPTITSVVVSADNFVNGSDTPGAVAYSGTVTNVENGQTVSLTIGGIATTAVVSGNAFSGTVNLSTVADRNGLSITANVSDAAGNPAPRFSGSFDKDTTNPSAPGLALDNDTGSSSTDGITSDGRVNVTGLEASATWQYSTNGGSTWITGTGNSFILDAGAFAGGAVQARQTDAAGNTGNAGSIAGVITVDTSAPSINTFAISSDNLVTGSDLLSAVAYSGTTTGVENGRIVSLNIGGIATTAVVGANVFSGTINISALADGTSLAVTADVSNNVGNPAPQFNGAFNKDTTAPVINTVAVSGDNIVSGSDTLTAVVYSGTTTGVENGQTVTLSIAGVATTATVSGDAFNGTVNLLGLADGSGIATTANVSDSAGNHATQFSGAFTKDTTSPIIDTFVVSTDNVVNGSDTLATVAYSGATSNVENGRTVTITIGGVTTTATVNAGLFNGTVNLSAIADANNIAMTANVSDVSGNPALQFNGTFDKDIVAPQVQSFSSATANGSYNAGDTVNITATTNEPVKSGNTITVTLDTGDSILLTAPANGTTLTGTYTVGAGDNTSDLTVSSFSIGSAQDLSGNAMTSIALPASNIANTSAIVVDTTAPTTTLSGVDISADTGTSATDFVTKTAAQTITATLSTILAGGEVLYGSVDGGSIWTDITSKVSGTAVSWNGATLSGTSSIEMKVADAAGNDGAVASQSYVLDNTAPTTTLSGVDISADTGTLATDFITKTAAQTITAILSTILAGGEVLYGLVDGGSIWTDITSKVSGTAVSWNGATLSGTSSIEMKVADAAGNDGAVASQSYVLDTTAPTTTLSGVDISADTGTLATDFITDTASQTITATLSTSLVAGEILYGSVNGGSSWADITSKVGGTAVSWDGATLSGSSSIQLKVTDAAGNDGAVASQAYVLDTTAPSITGPSGSAGAAGSTNSIDENTTAVHDFTANEAVTWSLSGGADQAKFSIDANSGVLSFQSAPNYEAPTDSGGNNVYDVRVQATDTAGNSSHQDVAVTVNNVAEANTSIVVFDLTNGTSSNHSGHSFSAGVDYDIYIKVQSADAGLSAAPAWSGAENLGAGDHVFLVGNGGNVLGSGNGNIISASAIGNIIGWWTAGGGTAAHLSNGGHFTRLFNGAGTGAFLDLWAGTGLPGTYGHLTALPAGITATQPMS